MDILAVLVVLSVVYRLHRRLTAYAQEYEASLMKAADFAVYVTHFPSNLTPDRAEQELSTHFQRLCGQVAQLQEGGACSGPVKGGCAKVVAHVYPASTSGDILFDVKKTVLAK